MQVRASGKSTKNRLEDKEPEKVGLRGRETLDLFLCLERSLGGGVSLKLTEEIAKLLCSPEWENYYPQGEEQIV